MFTKIATVETLKVVTGDNTVNVVIEKFRKEGTKREFFTPSIDGKRITRTMFARLYEAESFAKKVLRSKSI